jgi:hypothetical protein
MESKECSVNFSEEDFPTKKAACSKKKDRQTTEDEISDGFLVKNLDR